MYLFSHNVFFPFREFSTIFFKSEIVICTFFNPFPNDKFLDWSKLKELADNNFKFDENGRKFSKQVENTVGKGEIARYEQFFLFPQCFPKISTADTLKPGLVWERVKFGRV